MENNKLKGVHPSITELNLALYGQMDPDTPPRGYDFKKFWDDMVPNIDKSKIKGKALFFGTAGESNKANGFKEIWEYATTRNESEEEFNNNVKEIAKFFISDIYDTCATCGKLTKNNICKECSK